MWRVQRLSSTVPHQTERAGRASATHGAVGAAVSGSPCGSGVRESSRFADAMMRFCRSSHQAPCCELPPLLSPLRPRHQKSCCRSFLASAAPVAAPLLDSARGSRLRVS